MTHHLSCYRRDVALPSFLSLDAMCPFIALQLVTIGIERKSPCGFCPRLRKVAVFMTSPQVGVQHVNPVYIQLLAQSSHV